MNILVKGANIPDGCAIAPYSFVNKQFTDKNSLIAGIPAKIIKNDINWSSYSYRGYMKALEKENRLNPKWELEGLESIPVIPKERLPKYKIHPLNPQIFSVTNQKRRNGKKHKIITLCGIKFKFKKG